MNAFSAGDEGVYRLRRTQLKRTCVIPCIWAVLYVCEGNDTSQEEAGEGQKGLYIYRWRIRVAAKRRSWLQSPVGRQVTWQWADPQMPFSFLCVYTRKMRVFVLHVFKGHVYTETYYLNTQPIDCVFMSVFCMFTRKRGARFCMLPNTGNLL